MTRSFARTGLLVPEETGRLGAGDTIKQFNDVDQEDFFRALMEAIAAGKASGCVYEVCVPQGQEYFGQIVGRNVCGLGQVAS